jgi:hypothetical protein
MVYNNDSLFGDGLGCGQGIVEMLIGMDNDPSLMEIVVSVHGR